MDKLHAAGCVRTEDNHLTFVFNREPTDDEMRQLHDVVNILLGGGFRIVMDGYQEDQEGIRINQTRTH